MILQTYDTILDKLGRFTKKYYTKILIKGVLLFLALGMLVFMLTLGVEYFLWMGSLGRMILFFCCMAVGIFLLYTFIFIPLLFLFKVRRGITNKDAALVIGKHFPEIGDRLYNLLDLAENNDQTELLLASIEQRSENMKLIPFVKAVDFKENLKYTRYLIVPVLLFGTIWLSGDLHSFFGSYKRVVNYDMAYEPPAPFSFVLLNGELEAFDDKSYTISVTTQGEVRPESVSIVIDGRELLLQKEGATYKYTVTPPLEEIEFYFLADDVQSRSYRLNMLKTPRIQNFSMNLDYPDYLNRPAELVKGTGNATIPEGTDITWMLTGNNARDIRLIETDTLFYFNKKGLEFNYTKKIDRNYTYQIAASNENVRDYEKLEYRFKVIRDEFPTLNVEQHVDSLNPNVYYYSGESTDDYGLSSIIMVCYPVDREEDKQIIPLSIPNKNFEQFYYMFPSGLTLEDDVQYNLYFQATDNDALHGGKTVKSEVFKAYLLNDNELNNRELELQKDLIKNLDNSLDKFIEQEEILSKLNKEQKEKEQLSFNEQNRIKDFLKKQQEQEELMQKFSRELKENLNKSEELDAENELLQERLERQELEAKKNEKLLEELQKLADKIDKEELTKRLEDLGKKQKNSKRSLEQLLELTKRYYVTEKAAQLSKDLKKLGERQEVLPDSVLKKEEEKKEQQELNEQFNELGKELDELEKDNQNLKKPLGIKADKKKKESITEDQQKALEYLEKENNSKDSPENSGDTGNGAKKTQKQKSAGAKIKQMGEQLSSSAMGGGGSTIVEDAEMLRQILDNLLTFSFKQEGLFEGLEALDFDTGHISSTVRRQKELKGLFEHVDDSLFALSLRRAEMSEFVNEQITEVYYNIDKSLENFAESRMFQGVANQKYVLNASNNLADFLANLLDSMQQSMMSGSSSGSGEEGFQLPDIIKSQGELKGKMEGMQQSKEGAAKEGQQGVEEGQEKGEGQNGKDGNKGEKGDNSDQPGQRGKENGEGNGGGGQKGPSEEELLEIYEIYKEQQMLRQQLEEQLKDMINNADRKLGEKLVRQIEDFEKDLLENGVTPRTISKVNTIQHELLKLENAALKKGKKKERESNTNRKTFQNPILTKPSLLDNYRNEIEILNRQTLPLRQNFQGKVKEYFKNDN